MRTRSSLSIRSLVGTWALCGALGLSALNLAWASSGSILDVVASSREPWQKHKVKHGVLVERRPVAGSSFYEYRAMVTIPLAPALLIEDMWKTVEKPGPVVKKRQMLRKGETEIVFYDQIQTPVVSDRDYTMRLQKVALGGNRFQMIFQTANELGPGPDPKFVRIPAIRGMWIIQADPGAADRSQVTYQTYSDPGGSVPAFVIHGAHVDQVIKSLEILTARITNQYGSGAVPK